MAAATTLLGIALWKWLLGGAGLGYMGWGQYQRGKQMGGELGLKKETLAFHREEAKTGTEAKTQALKMQQAMTKKMWERLSTTRKEERGEARKERFETGQQASADRQLAMLLAALQSISGGVSRMGPSSTPAGIVDILRR